MRLGFTGTQRGLTPAQLATLEKWLSERVDVTTEIHHGDCIGADAQLDALADKFGIKTIIHPPIIGEKRAWCFRRWAMGQRFGESLGHAPSKRKIVVERTPKPYLARNSDIVSDTDALVACPGEMLEQLRSCTWATVRRARKVSPPRIRVFWPDGSTTLDT